MAGNYTEDYYQQLGEVWTPPGSRGMQTKRRDKYAPNAFVRKWTEGNEERLVRILQKKGSIKLRVMFSMMEDAEDVDNRNGMPIRQKAKGFRRWTPVGGKMIVIKKIPSAGRFFAIIEALTDAAVKEAQA